ncbi:hypothetical protein N8Z55_00155 [Pseudomonadales bacterium]|nr:hypothetical protein [Pseudomonadales bacterium]
MINQLIRHLKRVHFSKPGSADIIIFDETNSNLIELVIPKGLTVSIFKTRPVEFHITPIIILSFFKNLKYLELTNSSESNKKLFYRIFFQLLCIYIKADLMSRNPKAIITSIDNCTKFAWLSENFHQAPCIAIQNGFRLSYDANSMNKYYCQHLFCFGEREVIDYPKLGYKVDHFYPVGSLNLSLNFDSQLCDIKPIYDLLVVSCWRGNIGYAKDVEDSMKAMRLMDETLAQYLQNRDLKTAVIMRSERDSDQWVMPEIGMSEEDYYKSIYGDLIEIIDINFIERNVYPVMQSAEVIVAGFATTCLIEAYAMRKKVLYINFCGNNKYHRDFKPEIVFQGNENNYQLFEARLDELRMTSNDDYLMEHKDIMSCYINTSTSGSTREAIESKVNDIIASANT